MKKLIFASALALCSVIVTNAQEEKQPTAMNETPAKVLDVDVQAAQKVQDFKEIETADVPQVIKTAVEKKYEGVMIDNAYKNEKGEYKLLVSQDGDADGVDNVSQTVYLNAKGEFIKKQ